VASQFAVEDALPGGFSNINSISNGGTQTGSIISWSGLSLPPNGTAALTFNATVNAPAGGATYYCNTAQITASDEFDIDSTPNNDDGDQSEDDEAKAVIVPQQADLSLDKAVSDESPNVGDVVTFTVTVTNDGPDAATNVSITDPVPNGFSGISAISNGGSAAGNDITWSGLTIASGASTALTFNAVIEAPVAGAEFCNIAQVAASDQYDADSEPANDDGDQSEEYLSKQI